MNSSYQGMSPQQVQALLRFDRNDPKPAPPKVQAYSPPTKNPYLELSREKYLSLPQNVKESTLIDFWSPYFYKRSKMFPRIHRLFNVIGIDTDAVSAFGNLFSKKELEQRTIFMKQPEEVVDSSNGMIKFSSTLCWSVDGKEYATVAEGWFL